jgi:hypothetical protein
LSKKKSQWGVDILIKTSRKVKHCRIFYLFLNKRHKLMYCIEFSLSSKYTNIHRNKDSSHEPCIIISILFHISMIEKFVHFDWIKIWLKTSRHLIPRSKKSASCVRKRNLIPLAWIDHRQLKNHMVYFIRNVIHTNMFTTLLQLW